MLPREFARRANAYYDYLEADQDAEWSRTLLIVNHIRGAVGKRGMSLEDLKRRSQIGTEAPSRAEFEEDLKRIQEARAKAAKA